MFSHAAPRPVWALLARDQWDAARAVAAPDWASHGASARDSFGPAASLPPSSLPPPSSLSPAPTSSKPSAQPHQSQATHVLFESASGYALFDVRALDEIGTSAEKVQESIR